MTFFILSSTSKRIYINVRSTDCFICEPSKNDLTRHQSMFHSMLSSSSREKTNHFWMGVNGILWKCPRDSVVFYFSKTIFSPHHIYWWYVVIPSSYGDYCFKNTTPFNLVAIDAKIFQLIFQKSKMTPKFWIIIVT